MQKCPGATLWYYINYLIMKHCNFIFYSNKTRHHHTIISCLVVATGVGTWIAALIFGSIARLIIDEKSEASWILRFIYTIAGYTAVFLPCWVLIHLSRKHNLHSLSNFAYQRLRWNTVYNSYFDFAHVKVDFSGNYLDFCWLETLQKQILFLMILMLNNWSKASHQPKLSLFNLCINMQDISSFAVLGYKCLTWCGVFSRKRLWPSIGLTTF